jgi:chemotaxis protein methyltransferase CheR
VTDADLQALAYWVREHLGFADSPGRLSELRRAVHRAARESCVSDRSLVQSVLRDAPSDPQALQCLVPYLTVGETYFFRDTPLFQALQTRILPEVLAHAGPRPLRVWSAACSTGEEPYSIAMALCRVAPGTRHHIYGTDLNPRAILGARAHTYRPWSLRCLDDQDRRTWFAPLGDERWRLDPDIAERVQFEVHNLLDTQPPPVLQAQQMDVIFCRNVLIYLDIPSAKRVLRQLISQLTDGGWLVVAAVESFLVPTPPVEIVDLGDALAFRLPASQRHATPKWPFLDAQFQPADGTQNLDEEREFLPPARSAAAPGDAPSGLFLPTAGLDAMLHPSALWPAEVAAPPIASATPPPVAAAVLARLPAQGGESLFFAALAAVAEGRDVDAAADLRKLLFLSPSHVLGHATLAHLHLRHAQHTQAQRCLRNAIALLRDLPPAALLADGGGQKAGELLAELESMAAHGGLHG